jgi:DHA2 family multidrug resistance protein-like MFS transporter
MLASFGAFLLVAQYLQLVLGMGPLEAGLWTAPSGVVFAAGSLASPVLARRVRPANLMAAGLALSVAGLATMAGVRASGRRRPWWRDISPSASASRPVAALTTDMVVGSAPPERAGAAAGISETSFELGAALGIAVLGSLVTTVYQAGLGGATAGLPPGRGRGRARHARRRAGGGRDLCLPSRARRSSTPPATPSCARWRRRPSPRPRCSPATAVMAAVLLRRVAGGGPTPAAAA